MSSLVPAIIAGGVAVLSAFLSAAVALYTIRRASLDRLESRSQEFAMLLLPKRLSAYEDLWRALIRIEQTLVVDSSSADDLVASSIWLPPKLRNDLLSMLLEDKLNAQKVRQVRAELLADAAIDRIDAATASLTRREREA
ncbi:hypothetical protein [Actinomycetospora chiangmaiensis]|uniref:hypothetical protein n=1 Tax=Actinomycetospora chiangmaiensis TaxID=402650 RepID=UPI0003610320|nr:hypothetical protein [Actinomycetospora chiangmaiensis]